MLRFFFTLKLERKENVYIGKREKRGKNMITSANMSNPIGAVKPNFGTLTLKHDTNTLSKMFSAITSRAHDTVDRGQIQGNVGEQLSARALAKEFG